MPQYTVTLNIVVSAETPEAAALDVERLLLTTRPKEFAVMGPVMPTVFVRVERGEAKRVA